MKIHKEGHKILLYIVFVLILLNMGFYYFLAQYFSFYIVLPSLIFFGLCIYFFRDPKREIIISDKNVLSPADGKVVVIEDVEDVEYFKEKKIQISVFMSPLNVHVNKNPLSGEVIYSKYHSGKYLVAWHPKSSTQNERHTIVLKTDKAEILVKQIAGFVARRIVNYLKPGEKVIQGDDLGFIKFGSRVDILLPLDAKVKIRLHQKVKAGVTVLAELS